MFHDEHNGLRLLRSTTRITRCDTLPVTLPDTARGCSLRTIKPAVSTGPRLAASAPPARVLIDTRVDCDNDSRQRDCKDLALSIPASTRSAWCCDLM